MDLVRKHGRRGALGKATPAIVIGRQAWLERFVAEPS
jgi:hypothetical protein